VYDEKSSEKMVFIGNRSEDGTRQKGGSGEDTKKEQLSGNKIYRANFNLLPNNDGW
jgi:hypothetical protein